MALATLKLSGEKVPKLKKEYSKDQIFKDHCENPKESYQKRGKDSILRTDCAFQMEQYVAQTSVCRTTRSVRQLSE